ncbi:MAG: ribosomal protein S18-alanine N-acetyltransferase [Clostridia bacterium]|nr:ribosomal protein S18-alanine N-acetyltransferase [Clostridia bacterium]
MVKIEEMTFEDFEKIKAILTTEFDEFWTPSILKSELESKLSKYVVAKQDGNILGFAGVIMLPDDVEITNIVTKKTERKKGIGKLLLDKLIQIAFELEKDISLEVNEKNIPAINLYKNAGFKEVGIRKKYYNGSDNAIIMTKNFTI